MSLLLARQSHRKFRFYWSEIPIQFGPNNQKIKLIKATKCFILAGSAMFGGTFNLFNFWNIKKQ